MACELLAFPAFVLGVGTKHTDCAPWPDARVLFVPVGVGLIAHALLIAARMAPAFAALSRRPRRTIAGLAAAGLLCIAIGADRIHPSPAFGFLALPLLLAIVAWGGALVVRGPELLGYETRVRHRLLAKAPRLAGLVTLLLGVLATLVAVHVIPVTIERCSG